jgi:HEAT repeat protein
MRAWYAHFALAQLGERAAPAIPQFLAFVTNSPPRLSKVAVLPSDGSAAVEGLANIGPIALPAYMSLLTNADPQVRAFAIAQSQRFHINNSVILQLKNSLEDPDGRVRVSATNALRLYDQNIGRPSFTPYL